MNSNNVLPANETRQKEISRRVKVLQASRSSPSNDPHRITQAAWFIADANVLIDYISTDPDVLSLAAKHLGPIHVETAVLQEVEQLSADYCKKVGLTPVQANLEQLSEASVRSGSLSFQDNLCLILARDRGWSCLSNDGPLRKVCQKNGIKVVWGLELMFGLIQHGCLSIERSIEVAYAIHAINPVYITRNIVEQFQQKIRSLAGVQHHQGSEDATKSGELQ